MAETKVEAATHDEAEHRKQFLGIFNGYGKGRAGTDARLKAERVASLTPKQRSARKPPKQQINFRATAETKALIDALAEHLNKSVTDVLALAVEALANSDPSFKRPKA